MGYTKQKQQTNGTSTGQQAPSPSWMAWQAAYSRQATETHGQTDDNRQPNTQQNDDTAVVMRALMAYYNG